MSTAVLKISQSKKLNFQDVLCPICREIYIEPISLPCKHVVCLQCLERTVEINSLVCPICRTRIGTFLRLAKSLKKIVDQSFWQRLKKQFPSEIQKKLNGEEDAVPEGIKVSVCLRTSLKIQMSLQRFMTIPYSYCLFVFC